MSSKKKPVVKSVSTKPKKRIAQAAGPRPGFPIVGIGASAGGLEALELFLANVPAESGMAFVIVQHLDPTYKGMLVELLQRRTPMPVFQVKDRMGVEANCVYVIPPNKDLSILHSVLHLLAPPAAARTSRASPAAARLPERDRPHHCLQF